MGRLSWLRTWIVRNTIGRHGFGDGQHDGELPSRLRLSFQGRLVALRRPVELPENYAAHDRKIFDQRLVLVRGKIRQFRKFGGPGEIAYFCFRSDMPLHVAPQRIAMNSELFCDIVQPTASHLRTLNTITILMHADLTARMPLINHTASRVAALVVATGRYFSPSMSPSPVLLAAAMKTITSGIRYLHIARAADSGLPSASLIAATAAFCMPPEPAALLPAFKVNCFILPPLTDKCRRALASSTKAEKLPALSAAIQIWPSLPTVPGVETGTCVMCVC